MKSSPLTSLCLMFMMFMINTKGNSINHILRIMEPQKSPQISQEKENFDWPLYAPFYRFAGKRSGGSAPNLCDLHKYTLMELHDIIKDEVEEFEVCLARQGTQSL